MDVSFDASGVATHYDIASNEVSWNHTVASGEGGLLLVSITWRYITPDILSVKFNGLDLELIDEIDGGADTRGILLYGYHEPPSGTHAVEIVFNTDPGRGVFCSMSFLGTSTSAWHRDYYEAAFSGALPTATLTGDSSDISLLIACQNSNLGDTLWTETSPQTRIYRTTTNIGNNGFLSNASYKTGGNPSTVSIASGNNRVNAFIALSIMPPIVSSFTPVITFL